MKTKIGVISVFICLVLSVISSACQKRADDVELFNRFIDSDWCSHQSMGHGDYVDECYNFSNENRIYNYSRSVHLSDVSTTPGSTDRGFWNFQKTSKNSGLIFLTNGGSPVYGSVLQFSFNEDGSLTIADLILNGGGKNAQPQMQTIDQLSEIRFPEIFTKLTQNKWKKANQFDLYRLPTQIAFQTNGNYTATFRNGECFNTDIFSLKGDDLIIRKPKNSCDGRPTVFDKSLGTSSGPISFKNEFLVFQDSLYVPENYLLEGGIEWIGDVKISFSSQIKLGVPTPITIELKNNGPNQDLIKSFSISEQPVENVSGSYAPIRKEKVLSVADFSPSLLKIGESRTFKVNPIFTVRGNNSISFIFTRLINNKPFQSRKTFILDLQ